MHVYMGHFLYWLRTEILNIVIQYVIFWSIQLNVASIDKRERETYLL